MKDITIKVTDREWDELRIRAKYLDWTVSRLVKEWILNTLHLRGKVGN